MQEETSVRQEHLTQAALAERWRVSPRTLERWVGRGPQFLKVGGQVRYRLADILAYEQRQLRRDTRQPARAAC
jgi:hypothetical protein